MTDITIRPYTPDQLETLVQLERETFLETFPGLYSEADLQTFLSEKKSAAALAVEASRADAFFHLVYYQDQPAGFVKVNLDKQPDDGTVLATPVMELEKIYVLHAFHGYKLGKSLIRKVYEVAGAYGIRTLWLGVWENNLKAQGFYEREGFIKFGEHKFRVGQHEDNDWLLQKDLSPLHSI